jgi:hypothetical protein
MGRLALVLILLAILTLILIIAILLVTIITSTSALSVIEALLVKSILYVVYYRGKHTTVSRPAYPSSMDGEQQVNLL